jgi:RNA polymerase sigma factor (sigma-70 family)
VLQHTRTLPSSTELELEDPADRTAVREGEMALERMTVRQAVQKLAPLDRHLIALRYTHDYSHPEIARKLQIPEATARVRLHRAQQRLKPLLDESR